MIILGRYVYQTLQRWAKLHNGMFNKKQSYTVDMQNIVSAIPETNTVLPFREVDDMFTF